MSDSLLEMFIIEAAKILDNEKSCECSEGESCHECGDAEIEEVSTLAGGAIRGVVTPLGAGPRGRVRYKSGREKASPLNKGPSYYLKKGPASKPKRSFGKKKTRKNKK